jgi:Mlc titration factor MtfA (ptsG expression regulator)
VLAQHPFLSALPPNDQQRLRELCGHFLADKEFNGANGLLITDVMALAIAAQACMPLLHMARPNGTRATNPQERLDWYRDFVGIVVHPGAAVAQRELTDASGVVHRYREVLAGEAMHGGPIMLSWDEVVQAPRLALQGHNVVIHEFAHKFDMHGRDASWGDPDGAPPLPLGFLGLPNARLARERWRTTMQSAFDDFCEQVSLAQRFGGEKPWLDDYAAQSPPEFFAVTSEAYFVNRARFEQDFAALVTLYDGFYRVD